MNLKQSVVTASRFLADLTAISLTGLAIYVAAFGVFDEVWVRSGVVGLAMIVSLLAFSAQSLGQRRDNVTWGAIFANAVMLALLVVVFYFWISLMLEQDEAFVDFQDFHYIFGYLGFALIFYLTYKYFGLPLLLVCLFAFVYLVWGHMLPQSIAIPDLGWTRVSENIWYSFDGVFGRPVAVVGQIVLIFIIFGAVLETSGSGATLL
ncbi:MAG: hypothetical protein O3A84_13035, partial [Proteobacteria bacterium]|nr:hypothetical protein [Pseudomonadota bacterium]